MNLIKAKNVKEQCDSFINLDQVVYYYQYNDQYFFQFSDRKTLLIDPFIMSYSPVLKNFFIDLIISEMTNSYYNHGEDLRDYPIRVNINLIQRIYSQSNPEENVIHFVNGIYIAVKQHPHDIADLIRSKNASYISI